MSNDPRKFKTGIAVTGTTTVNGDTVTTNTAAQILTNKTIDADSNTLSNISNDEIKVGAAIDATKLADGSVSNTELQYINSLTSNAQDQLDAKIDDSEKGANNGVATLDAGGKIPVSQLPNSVMEYKGTYDATTNSPALIDGTGNTGDVYRVTVAGTQDFGSGNITFAVGDYVIYNGTVWEKADATDAVVSVNGQQGVVVLDTDDIAEGANLYFTDERAQDAVGTILTDSSKIDFTYDDVTPSITATIVAGSLVDADINASAAIDASKLADGSVSNTEFQFINTLTSNAQTQLDGKASTTLNNLGTTAINANLLPSANSTRNIGSATLNFDETYSNSIYIARGASGRIRMFDAGSVQVADIVATLVNTPAGNATNTSLSTRTATGGNRNIGIFSETDTVGNANATGALFLESGNKTAGTGNSGSITLRTGTSAGGVRGDVILNGRQIDASSTKIVNVTDPTNAQDAATKAYVDAATAGSGSAGDISETSFTLANNQVAVANVTGLAFANATVRGFKALVTVEIDATTDLNEVFELVGIQRAADWSMSVTSNGDDSLVAFTITNAGQIQYTSGNYAGFTTGKIKFRAETTTVG